MTETEPRVWLATVHGEPDCAVWGPDAADSYREIETDMQRYPDAVTDLRPAVVVPEEPTEEEVERVAGLAGIAYHSVPAEMRGANKETWTTVARAAIAAMRQS